MTAEKSRFKKQLRLTLILSAVLILFWYLSLFVGKYQLSFKEINEILSGGGQGIKRNVFWSLRLPRSSMAVIAGAGLGISGSVYQIIFKNPLATPDIIGVASGANLGTAAAIVLLGAGTAGLSAMSFAGALIVALLVIFLAGMSGLEVSGSFILAGIAVRAVAESAIMLLKVYADPERELAALEYWSMGSLKNITAEKLISILPFFLTGLLGLVLFRRQIALMGLEEDEARALGLPVGSMRILIISFATLVVASIICVSGLIGFVGLVAPHIARLILKRNSFFTAVTAAFIGALLLLLADCASRMTTELPISIYTSVVGIPVLIFYMLKRRRTEE